MSERLVNTERYEEIIGMFGNFDANIGLIESAFNVHIILRDGALKITGEPEDTENAAKVIENILMMAGKGYSYADIDVSYVISLVKKGEEDKLSQMGTDCICVTARGKPIKAKTIGQQKYIDAINSNTITVAIGPAGTGKTYLAVAVAVEAFRAKAVNRIIITRPAVEAGEKLGFLPGDLQNKVDPYLRPLYDALYDMMGVESYQRYLERGNIEVAPLAYMRGRTLDDAFIILDEAQNTTSEQMKMFLTRLGFNSKAVITGDITQIDLPDGKRSGLIEASHVLKNIDGIAIVKLNQTDVVRHKLVQKIINAYENYSVRKESEKHREK